MPGPWCPCMARGAPICSLVSVYHTPCTTLGNPQYSCTTFDRFAHALAMGPMGPWLTATPRTIGPGRHCDYLPGLLGAGFVGAGGRAGCGVGGRGPLGPWGCGLLGPGAGLVMLVPPLISR